MADFGTILNPLNTSKDLYCKLVDVDDNYYIKGIPINVPTIVKAYAGLGIGGLDLVPDISQNIAIVNQLPNINVNINVSNRQINIVESGDYSFLFTVLITSPVNPHPQYGIVFNLLVNGVNPNNYSTFQLLTINNSNALSSGSLFTMLRLNTGDIITISGISSSPIRINNGSIFINKL